MAETADTPQHSIRSNDSGGTGSRPRVRGSAHGRQPSSELADALDDVELFACLDREARNRLICTAEPRGYRRGEILFQEGCPTARPLLLLSGAAMLSHSWTTPQRAAIDVVRPRALLAAETLALDTAPVTSAEALRDSFALVLSVAELRGMMRQRSDLSGAVARWLVRQADRLAQLRADELALDLPARVARVLLRLASHGTGPVAVEVNQATLAWLTRSSRQSVNRVLQGFAHRGWLRVGSGNRIVMIDLAALSRRAGLMDSPK